MPMSGTGTGKDKEDRAKGGEWSTSERGWSLVKVASGGILVSGGRESIQVKSCRVEHEIERTMWRDRDAVLTCMSNPEGGGHSSRCSSRHWRRYGSDNNKCGQRDCGEELRGANEMHVCSLRMSRRCIHKVSSGSGAAPRPHRQRCGPAACSVASLTREISSRLSSSWAVVVPDAWMWRR